MRRIIRILSALFVVFVLGMFISCTPSATSGVQKQSTRAKTLPHREPIEEERDGLPVPLASLPGYPEV